MLKLWPESFGRFEWELGGYYPMNQWKSDIRWKLEPYLWDILCYEDEKLECKVTQEALHEIYNLSLMLYNDWEMARHFKAMCEIVQSKHHYPWGSNQRYYMWMIETQCDLIMKEWAK